MRPNAIFEFPITKASTLPEIKIKTTKDKLQFQRKQFNKLGKFSRCFCIYSLNEENCERETVFCTLQIEVGHFTWRVVEAIGRSAYPMHVIIAYLPGIYLIFIFLFTNTQIYTNSVQSLSPKSRTMHSF